MTAPRNTVDREVKVDIIAHALKHLGIGFVVTTRGAADEITIAAGDGRIAIRPDGTLRQAILDRTTPLARDEA